MWSTLAALFAPLIACVVGAIFAIGLNPTEPGRPDGAGQRLSEAGFFWFMAGLSLVIGAAYALPLLRHRLAYKKVKRGVLVAILLLLPTSIAVGLLADERNTAPPLYALSAVLFLALFVYAMTLRRSVGLLRWMRPEEDLQKLRRRVHQPLVEKAAFDIDAAEKRSVNPVSDIVFCLWVSVIGEYNAVEVVEFVLYHNAQES